VEFIQSEHERIAERVMEELQANLSAEMELERCAGIMQSITTIDKIFKSEGIIK
jgi:hypothetical protein